MRCPQAGICKDCWHLIPESEAYPLCNHPWLVEHFGVGSPFPTEPDFGCIKFRAKD